MSKNNKAPLTGSSNEVQLAKPFTQRNYNTSYPAFQGKVVLPNELPPLLPLLPPIAIAENNPQIAKSFLPQAPIQSIISQQAINTSRLIYLQNVQPEQTSWLWEDRVPFGKVTVEMGDPGIGKTHIALAIAAAVSSGGSLPVDNGLQHVQQGSVLYLSAEDDIAATIRPRLDLMGANCSNIAVYDETKKALTLKDDSLGILLAEEYVNKPKPKLIIIDPLQAYLGADTDMHRANEIRPIMQRLSALAMRYNLAIILISHMSKSGNGNSLYRALGSIDITAAARSVMRVGCDPNNPDIKAVAKVKGNLARDYKSIGFKIDTTYGFQWTGVSTLTAEMMNSAPDSKKSGGNQIAAAKSILTSALQNGPVNAKDIRTAMNLNNISDTTMNKAKKELGVKSSQKGYGSDKESYWSLPNSTSSANVCQTP